MYLALICTYMNVVIKGFSGVLSSYQSDGGFWVRIKESEKINKWASAYCLLGFIWPRLFKCYFPDMIRPTRRSITQPECTANRTLLERMVLS
jgi:hypothetical protein